MHYKNGRRAQVGDTVVGTTYNRKGTQVGKIVGITPGTDTCNCRVAITDVADLSPSAPPAYGRFGMVHVETGDAGPANQLLVPAVDYSACKDLLHVDDALGALPASVPDTSAPQTTDTPSPTAAPETAPAPDPSAADASPSAT